MRILVIAAALVLAGCDTGGDGGQAGNAVENGAASAGGNAAADEAAANGATAAAVAPGLAPCPFRRTSGWNGSIEGGRLLVGGEVDLMMAGMRPNLAERPGGGDTIALDLTMVPEAQALSNRARYERAGAGGLRRGEIWCGGERIAAFDLILID